MQSELPETDSVIIGVDVGGTKTHAAAFDHQFTQLAQHRVPTITGGVESVAAAVLDTVATLAAQFNGRPIAMIGVGIPGVVDPHAGTVRQAVNLGIGDEPLDLAPRLAAAFNIACRVDNDVNVAALGAYHLLRDEQHMTDLAYVSIGTGIRAGIILNGRLHRGHRGVAGEIGHIPINTTGPPCECGLRGCLEAVASGSAIARQWPATRETSPTEALIHAANAGDDNAIAILEPIADNLARAVYLLAVTYDVDRIIIGGGVADLGHLLLDPIKAGLARLETQSKFVRSLELRSRVLLKPQGAVGSIGAAILTTIDQPV